MQHTRLAQPNSQEPGIGTIADHQMATTSCQSACCKSHAHDCAGCPTCSGLQRFLKRLASFFKHHARFFKRHARCFWRLWLLTRVIFWIWFTIADSILIHGLWLSLFVHRVDEEGVTTQSSRKLESAAYVWLAAAHMFSPCLALIGELELFPRFWQRVSAHFWSQPACSSCHRACACKPY